MIKTAFIAVIYKPIYSALVFLIAIIPGGDVGVAVIILTCLVKLILFPFSQKASRAQIKMKAIQPELDTIKEKYKDNKEEQAKRMMALYKEKGFNPFSGVLILLIQIPIILALYYVILREGLPAINHSLVYSFISEPQNISMMFLGFLDITKKSIILAILVAVTQFYQMKLTLPKISEDKNKKQTFGNDFAKSMNTQMKYFMPAFTGFISYSLPAVVGLYWLTSNLFAIGQELYIRRNIDSKENSQIGTK